MHASDDSRGPLVVARAAYRLDTSDDDWLRELVDAAAPFLDRGGGIYATYYTCNADNFDFGSFVSREKTPYPFASFAPREIPRDVQHAAWGTTARRVAASVALPFSVCKTRAFASNTATGVARTEVRALGTAAVASASASSS